MAIHHAIQGFFGSVKRYPKPEGADCEVVNNSTAQEYDLRGQRARDGRKRALARWAIFFTLAALTALIYRGLQLAAEMLQEKKFEAMLERADKGDSVAAFGVYLAFVWGLSIPACLLVIWEPIAGGSGLPEIISYLNGVKVYGLLGRRTLFVKAIGLVCAVSAGLAIGPEGPTIHIGTILAVQSLYAFQFLFQRTRFGRYFNQLGNDKDVRTLVVAGSAAGIAVAFRAPIGGVMFVLEEAISFLDAKLIFKTYFVCISAYYVLEVVVSGRVLRTGDFTEFDVLEDCDTGYLWEDIFLFAILGVVGGLCGAAFNATVTRITALRLAVVNALGWRRLLEVVVIGLVTAALVVLCPINYPCTDASALSQHVGSLNYSTREYCLADEVAFLLENETASIEEVSALFESQNIRTTGCADSQYNELASLLYNTGHDTVNLLFSAGIYDALSSATLLSYLCIYFFLAAITAGISVPAGLVIPMLTIGGTVGRLGAILANTIIKVPAGIRRADPGPWAMVGAAAFWSGSGRITVTIAIIILEITGDLNYLPPIGIAVITAKFVANAINHGLYHSLIHLKHIPFLEDIPEEALGVLQVRSIMSSPVVSFRTEETVASVMAVLDSNSHNGFPVLLKKDGRDVVAGLVLRRSLRREIAAVQGNRDVTMDLTKAMNETPTFVMADSRVEQAFRLFRALGLRHLLVISASGSLEGIITRTCFEEHHDFPEPAAEYSMDIADDNNLDGDMMAPIVAD